MRHVRISSFDSAKQNQRKQRTTAILSFTALPIPTETRSSYSLPSPSPCARDSASKVVSCAPFICPRIELSAIHFDRLVSNLGFRPLGIMAVRLGLALLIILSAIWISDARQLPGHHPTVEFSRNENVCTLCEEFAAQALDYLGDNKTQTEVLKLLHESCSRVPTFKQQCNTLVDYYAPLFFLEVSSIQPGEFCQKVNLCEQMALLSTRFKEDSCQLCHHAVSEVLEKLKDPDTQMDIIEMLMKACNSMEKKYVKKCKRMVFEYGPLVLANAEQFLENKDLCLALHACKSSAISSPESSSDITIGLSES